MSWTPDPADYTPPQNAPAPAGEPEAVIGPEPIDAPTVTGDQLTENVNQAGAA